MAPRIISGRATRHNTKGHLVCVCMCVYDYPLHNLRKQKDSICQGLDEVIMQDTVHMHTVSMAAPNKQCVRVVTLPGQKRGRTQMGRKARKS